MASELRVNTLKDASGNNSVATSFVAGGSAKCYALSAVGAAATTSLNLTSITDNGTGVYTVNFATAFPDTDYACVGAASPASESHGSHSNVNIISPDGLAKTTSSQGINCRYVHGYTDPVVASVAIFR